MSANGPNTNTDQVENVQQASNLENQKPQEKKIKIPNIPDHIDSDLIEQIEVLKLNKPEQPDDIDALVKRIGELEINKPQPPAVHIQSWGSYIFSNLPEMVSKFKSEKSKEPESIVIDKLENEELEKKSYEVELAEYNETLQSLQKKLNDEKELHEKRLTEHNGELTDLQKMLDSQKLAAFNKREKDKYGENHPPSSVWKAYEGPKKEDDFAFQVVNKGLRSATPEAKAQYYKLSRTLFKAYEVKKHEDKKLHKTYLDNEVRLKQEVNKPVNSNKVNFEMVEAIHKSKEIKDNERKLKKNKI